MSGAAGGGLRAGLRVGPYELRSPLGEGGYGSVWLAERLEPYAQQVAIKFIKPGIDSRRIVARFERERQALARMNHPGIARILDGGLTDDGRPFVAMEFVAGKPITEWCDEAGLDLRGRLALFAQVCDAVQHAHARGMIHRDLKPSNILAMRDGDGRAVARVIDFGIAKVLDDGDERAVAASMTEEGQLLGTPEYMSPEQADPDGAEVDTRSDVYGLGAVLHELLVGAPPFGGRDGGTRSRAMLLRSVRRDPVPAPSSRNPSLPREIDWILLMALRKEPAERYASAAELARDLRGYLAGDAVLAAPAGAAYRFRSYARRNRVQVVAAAAVLATLVASTAVSAWFAFRERDARRETERRADEVQRLSVFQAELLDDIDPAFVGAWAIGDVYKRGDEYLRGKYTDEAELKAQRLVFNRLMRAIDRSATGAEVVTKVFLAPASDGVEAKLGDLPRAAAAMHDALARRYALVADFTKSLHHADRALELRRATLGDRHREVGLSHGVRGTTLYLLVRLDEAEAAYLEADAILRETCGAESPEVLANAIELARIPSRRGDMATAARILGEATAIAERLHGAAEPNYLGLRRDYARALANLDRFSEAEPIARAALDGFNAAVGPEGIGALRTVPVLAMAMAGQGRFAEAEPLLVDAVARASHRFGVEDSDTLGMRCDLMRLRARHAPARIDLAELGVLRDAWVKRFGAEGPEVAWMDQLRAAAGGGGEAASGGSGSTDAARGSAPGSAPGSAAP